MKLLLLPLFTVLLFSFTTVSNQGFFQNNENVRVVGEYSPVDHADQAKKMGYIKVNERSNNQAVYFKSSAKSDLKYISPDVDSHNGGYWKAASSVSNLGSKSTRSGTYNEDLSRRIGD